MMDDEGSGEVFGKKSKFYEEDLKGMGEKGCGGYDEARDDG